MGLAWNHFDNDEDDRFVVQESAPRGDAQWFVRVANTGNNYVGFNPRLICVRIQP